MDLHLDDLHVDVTLTQLRYFRAAAHAEHFTKAARSCNVAQPALSRQIRDLENELGLNLFDRVGRGVKLTAAGKVVLPRVDRILQEEKNILRDLRALQGLESGTVALGFLHSIGAHMLPKALAAFRAEHAAISFTLQEGSWSELDERVRSGDLDLAIVSPLPPRESGLEGVELLHDELVAALPPTHRLAAAREIHLSELKNEPFIFLRATFGELRTLTSVACQRAGFEPRMAFETEGLATMRGLVGAGLGVALLPAMASHVREEGGPTPVCVPLAGRQTYRVIGLVHQAERALSPAANAFRALLIDQFARRPNGAAASRSSA